MISSTKISQVLTTVGLKYPIPNIKALLKELGFIWNGASCTFQQLLQRCKEYVEPKKVEIKDEGTRQFNLTDDDKKLITLKRTKGQTSIQDIVKDLFYTTGKTLYQIYREFGTGESMAE